MGFAAPEGLSVLSAQPPNEGNRVLAKGKTKITIETHSLTILRATTTSSGACSVCGCVTPHVTVEQTAAIEGITQTSVFQMVQDGRLHSKDTASGGLLICVESLRQLHEE